MSICVRLMLALCITAHWCNGRLQEKGYRRGLANTLASLDAVHPRRHFKLVCNDENEVYLPEGIAPTCGDAKCETLEGRPSLFYRAPAGCYCRGGYARDCQEHCVPTEQCKQPLCSGPNEMYMTEGLAPSCDAHCRRLDRKRQCSRQKDVGGCYCIEGAARNTNFTCVPQVNCPMAHRHCYGTNEVYLRAKEAPPCDRFCNKATLSAAIAQDDEDTALLPAAGCYCREGYYRNDNMQCVERKYCKVKCPGKHEIFLPRGTAPRCENRCSATCPNKCLPLLDMPEGCYCMRGYCKNQDGACVLEHNTIERGDAHPSSYEIE